MWDSSSEDIAKTYYEISSTNVWVHSRTAVIFKDRSVCFAVPRIILSSIVASAALALEYVKDHTIKSYVLLGVAAVGAINSLIGSLAMFFNFSELSGTHRASSESWNALCRRIELCLKKPPDRRAESERFLEECAADFARLSESSPVVPSTVITEFRNMFAQKLDSDFSVAYFLNGIHELVPYKPDEPASDGAGPHRPSELVPKFADGRGVGQI